MFNFSMDYELSEKTISVFLDKDSKIIPENKNEIDWEKKDWSKVPIDYSDCEIFTMCLSYSIGNIKLKSKLNEIKKY